MAGFLCWPIGARAQTSAPAPDPPQTPAPGLPPNVAWTFNFDGGWGTFGFANSLFDTPRDQTLALSDQWFEGFIKPALSGVFAFKSSAELYGRVSAVGERSYGAPPASLGHDTSLFGVDEAYVGWRSGPSSDSTQPVLDVLVGRANYVLGHGMLVMDGTSVGGNRGAFWSNPRQAFALAAIGRVRPGPHLAEVFYLDKDEVGLAQSGTRLWGANYEFSFGEDSTVGASYMTFFADPAMLPARDGLHVINLRAYAAPIQVAPDVSVEFEYTSERNGELLRSNAWTVSGGYTFSPAAWSPKVSYRYAWFQGDDPATTVREGFDPLLVGLYDWGQWFQGEIAGEYFLPNSNLVSHQIRVHVDPTERLGAGAILYRFLADQPGAYGAGVTSRNIALELDLYADWELNGNVTVSLIGAFADPGLAVQQARGRTKNFTYGMVYVGYSF